MNLFYLRARGSLDDFKDTANSHMRKYLKTEEDIILEVNLLGDSPDEKIDVVFFDISDNQTKSVCFSDNGKDIYISGTWKKKDEEWEGFLAEGYTALYIKEIKRFFSKYKDLLEREDEVYLIDVRNFFNKDVFVYEVSREKLFYIYKFENLVIYMKGMSVLKITKSGEELKEEDLNSAEKEFLSYLEHVQAEYIASCRRFSAFSIDSKVYIEEYWLNTLMRMTNKYKKTKNLEALEEVASSLLIISSLLGVLGAVVSMSKSNILIFFLLFLPILLTCFLFKRIENMKTIKNKYESVQDLAERRFVSFSDVEEVIEFFDIKDPILSAVKEMPREQSDYKIF